MDRVNEVVKSCLDAAVQLRRAEPSSLPQPEQLHHRLKGYVDELLRKTADVGFSHQDGQDIAYAVVAFLDEIALTKGEAIRQHWQTNPLQVGLFGENLAGENFFTRLQTLRADHRRHEVLRVYYLCLTLGFQGRYRVRGGELELLTLTDALQKELARARTQDPETLSPNGERPPDSLVSARGIGPLLILSGAAVGLALVIYVGLWFSLKISVSSAGEEIQSVGRGLGAPLPEVK